MDDVPPSNLMGLPADEFMHGLARHVVGYEHNDDADGWLARGGSRPCLRLPLLIVCLLCICRERDRNGRKLDIILGNSLTII